MVDNNNLSHINYCILGPTEEDDRMVNAKITHLMHDELKNFLSGLGCSEDTFPLQVKENSKPYQVPLRCVAYVLKKPFKEELEQIQQ